MFYAIVPPFRAYIPKYVDHFALRAKLPILLTTPICCVSNQIRALKQNNKTTFSLLKTKSPLFYRSLIKRETRFKCISIIKYLHL